MTSKPVMLNKNLGLKLFDLPLLNNQELQKVEKLIDGIEDQERRINKSYFKYIIVYLFFVLGPLIGLNFKERIDEITSQKVQRSVSNDIMSILHSCFILIADIKDGKNTENLEFNIPQIGGDFSKIGAIDTELQKRINEIISKKFVELSHKTYTTNILPFWEGSFTYNIKKLRIQGVEGYASAENFGKQSLNDLNDLQNQQLATKRAENFLKNLGTEIQNELAQKGTGIQIDEIQAEGKIIPFNDSELNILENLGKKYNKNESINNKTTILRFLYDYHNNKFTLDSEDKTAVENILNPKRTVKISVIIDEGITKKRYIFLPVPLLMITAMLYGCGMGIRVHKQNKFLKRLFKAIKKGKSDEEINNIINKYKKTIN